MEIENFFPEPEPLLENLYNIYVYLDNITVTAGYTASKSDRRVHRSYLLLLVNFVYFFTAFIATTRILRVPI